MLGRMVVLEWAPYVEELVRSLAAGRTSTRSAGADPRLPGLAGGAVP